MTTDLEAMFGLIRLQTASPSYLFDSICGEDWTTWRYVYIEWQSHLTRGFFLAQEQGLDEILMVGLGPVKARCQDRDARRSVHAVSGSAWIVV